MKWEKFGSWLSRGGLCFPSKDTGTQTALPEEGAANAPNLVEAAAAVPSKVETVTPEVETPPPKPQDPPPQVEVPPPKEEEALPEKVEAGEEQVCWHDNWQTPPCMGRFAVDHWLPNVHPDVFSPLP